MTIVSTMGTTKNDRIYVRVNDEIKDDFERVAAYRGLKMSALLHSLMVKTINEQREKTPQLFSAKDKTNRSASASSDSTAGRAKIKAKKAKKSMETISTERGEITLIDEAVSVANGRDD